MKSIWQSEIMSRHADRPELDWLAGKMNSQYHGYLRLTLLCPPWCSPDMLTRTTWISAKTSVKLKVNGKWTSFCNSWTRKGKTLHRLATIIETKMQPFSRKKKKTFQLQAGMTGGQDLLWADPEAAKVVTIHRPFVWPPISSLGLWKTSDVHTGSSVFMHLH